MPNSTHDEWQQMIDKYNKELMAQYASVAHTAVSNAEQSAPSSTEQSQPDQQSTEHEEQNETPPPTLTDIGSLQVRVSTEDQAVPIEGAVVTVSHNSDNGVVLDRTFVTDNSGLTPLIDLATKDRALSLTPGNPSPFSEYTVQVVADGYYTKRFERIPIYGGVTAIQSVSMIPLPEFTENDIPIVYNEPVRPTL